MIETSRFTLAWIDDVLVEPSLRKTMRSRTASFYAFAILEGLAWAQIGVRQAIISTDDLEAWMRFRSSAFERAKKVLDQYDNSAVVLQALDIFGNKPENGNASDQDRQLYLGILAAVASFSELSSKAFQIWLLAPSPLRESLNWKDLENAIERDSPFLLSTGNVLSGFLRAREHITLISDLVGSKQSTLSQSLTFLQRWRMDLVNKRAAFMGCARLLANSVTGEGGNEKAIDEFLHETENLINTWNRLTYRYSAAGA